MYTAPTDFSASLSEICYTYSSKYTGIHVWLQQKNSLHRVQYPLMHISPFYQIYRPQIPPGTDPKPTGRQAGRQSSRSVLTCLFQEFFCHGLFTGLFAGLDGHRDLHAFLQQPTPTQLWFNVILLLLLLIIIMFFSVPFLHQSTRPITWNKISGGEKTTITLHDRSLVLSLFPPLSPSPPHLPTQSVSVGLLKKISFKWWSERWDGAGWPDFIRDSVQDCRRSRTKWPHHNCDTAEFTFLTCHLLITCNAWFLFFF